jgi:hypothetical protein
MSFLSAQYHLFLLDAWRIQAQLLSLVRNWLQDLSSCILGRDFLIWPPSPSRPEVNTQWLSRVLGVNVTSVATGELDENRGFVGGLKVLMVETSQGMTSLVLKTSQPNISRRLAGLGNMREALYYNSKYAIGPSELGRIPKVYYSHGSNWLREMVVLMEDLESPSRSDTICIGLNKLMGNQIWGVSENTPLVDKFELLKAMYFHAAEMHARFWMDQTLLQQKWMRNARWYSGDDRQYWEFSIGAARQGWEQIRSSPKVKYPPGFVSLVDESFANSSWEKLQHHLKHAPYTLTHGDFHAANMIIHLPANDCLGSSAEELLRELKVFDWSEVGPWEPTTDLAQTVISDFPAGMMNQVENALRAYHERLKDLGIEDYMWEECLRRFGESGIERWIWVLGVMSSLFDLTSSGLGQYFVDQMNAFRMQFCPDQPYFVLKTCGYVLPKR